jgi:hypothetical protein
MKNLKIISAYVESTDLISCIIYKKKPKKSGETIPLNTILNKNFTRTFLNFR